MTTVGVLHAPAWLYASLLLTVAWSAFFQPALGGSVLQPAVATSHSAGPCVREGNFEMRVRRGMTSLTVYAWPNATVPYHISEQFNDKEIGTLLFAMEWWTLDTCLQFVQRTNETQYLFFVRSSSCSSPVGKQPQSEPQMVKINQKCLDNVGFIAHEIGHALGFWHEHQRPDRDEFVEVLYDNIPLAYHHLFFKLPEEEINSLHVDYDYGSIMHLSLFAYSFDQNTPSLRLLKEYSGEVGQRKNTSESDREQVRLFYGCQGTDIISKSSNMHGSSEPAQLPMPTPMKTASTEITKRKQSELPTHSPSQSPLPEDTPSDSLSPHLPSQNVTLKAIITKMSPTSSPFPSPSLRPISEIPENLAIIAAGVEFGMRIVTEPDHDNLWMACKGQRSKTCSLNQCPSKRGLHQQKCQGSTYILEKINGSNNASIIVDRDWVALRPSSNISSIVHCGDKSKNKAKSVCKYSSNGCEMLGELETESCSYHIMEVHLHKNNSSGNSPHHQVSIHFLDKEMNSWLGCNLHDKMKCKRFFCENNQPCTPDRFELIEISS